MNVYPIWTDCFCIQEKLKHIIFSEGTKKWIVRTYQEKLCVGVYVYMSKNSSFSARQDISCHLSDIVLFGSLRHQPISKILERWWLIIIWYLFFLMALVGRFTDSKNVIRKSEYKETTNHHLQLSINLPYVKLSHSCPMLEYIKAHLYFSLITNWDSFWKHVITQ